MPTTCGKLTEYYQNIDCFWPFESFTLISYVKSENELLAYVTRVAMILTIATYCSGIWHDGMNARKLTNHDIHIESFSIIISTIVCFNLSSLHCVFLFS